MKTKESSIARKKTQRHAPAYKFIQHTRACTTNPKWEGDKTRTRLYHIYTRVGRERESRGEARYLGYTLYRTQLSKWARVARARSLARYRYPLLGVLISGAVAAAAAAADSSYTRIISVLSCVRARLYTLYVDAHFCETRGSSAFYITTHSEGIFFFSINDGKRIAIGKV